MSGGAEIMKEVLLNFEPYRGREWRGGKGKKCRHGTEDQRHELWPTAVDTNNRVGVSWAYLNVRSFTRLRCVQQTCIIDRWVQYCISIITLMSPISNFKKVCQIF